MEWARSTGLVDPIIRIQTASKVFWRDFFYRAAFSRGALHIRAQVTCTEWFSLATFRPQSREKQHLKHCSNQYGCAVAAVR
jgi:hypothetical protein